MKPYYKQDGITLYLSDCREELSARVRARRLEREAEAAAK